VHVVRVVWLSRRLPGVLVETRRPNAVTPAKAGVQGIFRNLDSGFRRTDDKAYRMDSRCLIQRQASCAGLRQSHVLYTWIFSHLGNGVHIIPRGVGSPSFMLPCSHLAMGVAKNSDRFRCAKAIVTWRQVSVGQAFCRPGNGGQDARPTRASPLLDTILGNHYKQKDVNTLLEIIFENR